MILCRNGVAKHEPEFASGGDLLNSNFEVIQA